MNETVQTFKLLNGMDIIGKVTQETDTHYALKDAVAVQIVPGQMQGQAQLGFAPVSPVAERTGRHMGTNIDLPKVAVMFQFKSNEHVLSGYIEAVSGIAVATSVGSGAASAAVHKGGISGRHTVSG
jgi:hypothetical protein